MRDLGSPEDAVAMALRPGSWDWDVREDVLMGDERLAELFALDPKLVHNGLPLDRVLYAVHPDDRNDLYISIARSIEFCVGYEATYRIGQDESVRWIHAIGRCYETKLRKRHVGIAFDVTGLRTSLEQEVLRLDCMAQHCLAAYRLARKARIVHIADAIGASLRKIGEELAKKRPHH
ncbi:MAG: hybrid sensor histidine kinase/response regulator [Hyphomicrobiales bacterium]|nr:hybrid sensor histidine kinase/response regulator [Hyphomicrobiales bacterium]